METHKITIGDTILTLRLNKPFTGYFHSLIGEEEDNEFWAGSLPNAGSKVSYLWHMGPSVRDSSIPIYFVRSVLSERFIKNTRRKY